MANITINTGISYQTVKAWRARAEAGQEWLLPDTVPQYPSDSYAQYKNELLDVVAETGINGLSLEFKPLDVSADPYDVDNGSVAIQPTTATAGQFHYERMTRAMDDIGLPLKAILESRGETLKIHLLVVDFRDAGYDLENTPSEYAYFVYKFVDKFFTTYGFLPDSIEAICEPGTGQNVTNWTRAKVANNLAAAAAYLESHGYHGIEWIAPSVEDGSTVSSWWTDMKAANANITDYVTDISYHGYTRPSNAALDAFLPEANADGASLAMLEHIAADYQELYNDLAHGHISIWEQFTIAFPWSGATDDGGAYFQVDPADWSISLGARTRLLKQYFKYVRSGAVMKGVTNSDPSYLGLPFVNPNNSYVCVVWADGTNQVNVKNLPAGTYGISYALDSGPFDQTFSNQTIADGEDVTFTPPSSGVFTVFDVNYLEPPAEEVTKSAAGFRSGIFGSGQGFITNSWG